LSDEELQERNGIKKEGEKQSTYFNPKWKDEVRKLSDEELQERINSKDWQPSYRELCELELRARK
jgi:hypothetical protein